jgi:hypothetical protein
MIAEWFNFKLGFADDGCDGDTVRHILSVLSGLVVHIEGIDMLVDPNNVVELDVVVDTFEQPDDPYNNFPVYLTGWVYDDTHALDDQYRGARVRIPLKGSRITVY